MHARTHARTHPCTCTYVHRCLAPPRVSTHAHAHARTQVPCPASRFLAAAMEDDTSAFYAPLLRSRAHYVPTNFHAAHSAVGMGGQIQDLLLVDERQVELHQRLRHLGRRDCRLPTSDNLLNATRPAAAAWLAQAAPGHCGATDTRKKLDCEAGGKGALGLHPDEAAGGWEQAASACLTRCAGCTRCKFISLSLRWMDCSFYHSCSMHALHADVSGFRSGKVPFEVASLPRPTVTDLRRSRSLGRGELRRKTAIA